MTTSTIPIIATQSQTFTIQLDSQSCTINIYQKSTGLYFDLFLDGSPVAQTMLCLNQVGLIRNSYLGFNGQLSFVDTKGQSDPSWEGLGNRFALVYEV